MLGELRIRDLVVIDDARLEVSPGLNVLPGETGAGKTMVVDALTLLLGERADPGAVRAGRAAALVEGRLDTDGDGQVAAALAAAGAAEEEGEVVVARQVLAEGRSRAQLQGRMATVAAIAEVVRPLVEVHGQHEFQRLLRPAVQRDLLDRFAGDKVLALRDEFGAGWRRLRAVRRELDELASRARDREREAELLRYQLEEIEAAGVRVGELDELDAESERLTNAESLREAAVTAWQFLEGDEDAGASMAMGAAARAVSGPGRHDQALGELAERASGLAAELADLASSLRAYAEGVLADPRRLDAEASTLRARLADMGGSLSALRAEAAAELAASVQAELRELAMPSADLRMLVEQDEGPDGLEVSGRRLAAGDEGLDRVEMQLSANPGLPLRPLAKAASGGEMSRVMLALRVVLAGVDRTPTLVFDEVDAGVGGRTAAAVAYRLAALARHHQVLVVTHLPQIAAYADRHFVVEKHSVDGQTSTAVRTLDSGGRITELSRMLSGMEGSGLAQANAEDLLAAANAAKARPLREPRAAGTAGAAGGSGDGHNGGPGTSGASGPRAAVGGESS